MPLQVRKPYRETQTHITLKYGLAYTLTGEKLGTKGLEWKL